MRFFKKEKKPGSTDPAGVPSGSDGSFSESSGNAVSIGHSGSTGYSGNTGYSDNSVDAPLGEESDLTAGGLSQSAYTEDGRFLKNPLPVPKRRAHVRMEFDLVDDWDLPPEKDHFDLEIPEDDDFDLQ